MVEKWRDALKRKRIIFLPKVLQSKNFLYFKGFAEIGLKLLECVLPVKIFRASGVCLGQDLPECFQVVLYRVWQEVKCTCKISVAVAPALRFSLVFCCTGTLND